MPQLLYSPNLAPAEFFPFLKMKIPMKGNRFVTIEEIKEKSKQKLFGIPKRFEDWKKVRYKCTISDEIADWKTR